MTGSVEVQQRHINTVGHVRDHDEAADSSRELCHRRGRVGTRQVLDFTLTNTAPVSSHEDQKSPSQ